MRLRDCFVCLTISLILIALLWVPYFCAIQPSSADEGEWESVEVERLQPINDAHLTVQTQALLWGDVLQAAATFCYHPPRDVSYCGIKDKAQDYYRFVVEKTKPERSK